MQKRLRNKASILIIVGPTASGKSDYAFKISSAINSTIINADALQIYKDLPILSAQPSKQDLEKFDCKLYGFLEHNQIFSVHKWLELTVKEINDAFAQDKMPIIVGGTGMYIKSLVDGINEIPSVPPLIRSEVLKILEEKEIETFSEMVFQADPLIRGKINPNDKARLVRAYETKMHTGKSITEFYNLPKKTHFKKEDFLILDTSNIDRDLLYDLCNKRFLQMMENGALQEVESVRSRLLPCSPAAKTIGYQEISGYLAGEISLAQMSEKVTQSTRNYAKRQLTWFRNQIEIKHDINHTNLSEVIESLMK